MSAHHMRKQNKNAGHAAQDSKVSETFFHKTKLCKFFPQGACVKGTNCSFAHVQAELLVPPDLYRTRMCMAFIKAGKCKDGDHCKYAHSRGELRTGTVPCSLAAACDLPDDSMLSVSAPVTPQATYSAEQQPPSPAHSAGPLITMPDQQCFATGFASPSGVSPYICLPVDQMGGQMNGQMSGQMNGQMGSQMGGQMFGQMGSQLMGSVDSLSMSPMSPPVNHSLFFEDGAAMKHSMTPSSMTSTSGHAATEDDLLSFHVSSRRSSSDYGIQEGRSLSSASPEHDRSETGSDEQQQDEADTAGDSRAEKLFLSKMVKVKDHHMERQDSAGSKFDVYLPQITEEQVNDDQNTEEERSHEYCSTEDYLDERADILQDNMFLNFNRQLSCPAGFNFDDEEDEEAILNNFQKQKWDRQCSAPACLYKDTFLDLKVGNEPVFHQSTGYHVAIKNTFLDFGQRPEEINRLRERRPSF
mmetsp:Transcript_81507/g.141571  ORF Transcript_81507/g.141571 Transcript_81507/m.141571 type:complete len:470 (-) Transcript_81507:301-1710(-)